jgi:hypothetical protein
MSSAVIIQLVIASVFNKHFFLVGRYFLQTDPKFCMKVAETACWDLEYVLNIFALVITIAFLSYSFLLYCFMVINKYYLSLSRMEYQANLLWIPKDSPYNLNEVCSKKVEGNEK